MSSTLATLPSKLKHTKHTIWCFSSHLILVPDEVWPVTFRASLGWPSIKRCFLRHARLEKGAKTFAWRVIGTLTSCRLSGKHPILNVTHVNDVRLGSPITTPWNPQCISKNFTRLPCKRLCTNRVPLFSLGQGYRCTMTFRLLSRLVSQVNNGYSDKWNGTCLKWVSSFKMLFKY